MPVQKLIAKTTNEGLKRIRDEFGKDALILKTIKRNGKVEFFVEADDPAPDEQVPVQAEAAENADPGLKVEYREARLKMLSAIAAEADTQPVHQAREQPAAATSQRRAGMQMELTVKSLIEGLELSPATGARLRGFKRIDEVVDNLSMLIGSTTGLTEGIHAFVGPAGSGKTTSMIKLLTRHVFQFGEDSCAIINCDRFRMGAREQMTRLGELMGVDVLHVGPDLDLNRAIASVHKRQFVAIDMPGLGMEDEQLKAELFRLSSSHYDIRRFLVLPANLQFSAMRLAQSCFAARKGTSCILTRLDETSSLGAAMSFLVQSELPLAYTSNGPHIPEDIKAGRGADLVQESLKMMGGQFAKAALTDLTIEQGISHPSYGRNPSGGQRPRAADRSGTGGADPNHRNTRNGAATGSIPERRIPQDKKVMDL